jgi:hypothetical protein
MSHRSEPMGYYRNTLLKFFGIGLIKTRNQLIKW